MESENWVWGGCGVGVLWDAGGAPAEPGVCRPVAGWFFLVSGGGSLVVGGQYGRTVKVRVGVLEVISPEQGRGWQQSPVHHPPPCVWEWGKGSSGGGRSGSSDVDGPPSPTAQEDFGMDLVLPAEVGECAGSPSAAPSQEVEDWDSAGMGGPPSPMAQDDFGIDLPISPGVHAWETGPAPLQQDGLQIEGIAADLALRLLPTEAGEHTTIPSAVYVRTLGGHDVSPFNSQMPGGYGYETLQLLQEPAQHPPEQVWNIYQQEKEMCEVIDDIIEQLDNIKVLDSANTKVLDQKTYECCNGRTVRAVVGFELLTPYDIGLTEEL
ncbi:hypothetical protein EDB87DRAFT_1756685 [Lactarius vividus]|nr:hypothetical protein EDB87DRAFT_1756685 [Lactarius vividus]